MRNHNENRSKRTKPIRLSFTLPSAEYLKELAEVMDEKNTTTVIRNALTLFAWALEKSNDGYAIIAKSQEGSREIEYPLVYLFKAISPKSRIAQEDNEPSKDARQNPVIPALQSSNVKA